MNLNKENLKKIRGLIVFTVILLIALWNYSLILDVLGQAVGIVYPFLLGGAIAFVINVPMSFFEEKLFQNQMMKNKKVAQRLARPVSLIITLIVVVSVIGLVVFGVLPKLGDTFISIGKGITAASLGRLLKARGYTVTMQKFDPYINIDPGTMNPVQHGEVFVTDDGAETDLDLGHYERFIDESLTKNSNVTTGKIYWSVLQKERRGDFGGGTVQVIPHITNEIKSRFYRNPSAENTEIAIIEVGGTVGDIESQPFLESIRQFQHEKGRDNVILIHVTLIPYLRASQEMKTKPTQASVKELQVVTPYKHTV